MIGFLHPGIAIAAVAAVALPIAIHFLFRRRRVPIDWAAMELLREAIRRTNRRLRMEQWLVLALRSLAVLAAGLAIAAPILEGAAAALGGEARVWMVVLDDGATSGVRIGRSDELARLRDEARAVLAARGPRDRVGLVLASAPPRMILAPTADPAQFERALDASTAGETPSELDAAIALARSALDAEMPKATGTIVVASAFRRASLGDEQQAAAATPAAGTAGDAGATVAADVEIVAIVPATDVPDDVRIERIEARPAPIGDSVVVRALVAREGGSLGAAVTRVRASADGCNDAAPREIAWEAGQAEASVEFQLVPSEVGATPGALPLRAVRVSIGEDALSVGNVANAAIEIGRELEVGVIGRRGAIDAGDLERIPASLWVARALAPSPGDGTSLRIREIDPSSCDARSLLGLDAVVVARPDLLAPSSMDALGAFVREGRVAIVLPAGESLAQGWATPLLSKLDVPLRAAAEAVTPATPQRLAEEQPTGGMLSAIAPELASLVGPIEVPRFLPLEGLAAGEIVLSFADGTPFVAAQSPGSSDEARQGRGLVIVLAAAPELSWTNLPVKPLMVPLFQELVRSGLDAARGGDEAFVGERVASPPGSTLVGERGDRLLVGADGRTEEIAPRAGIWKSEDGRLVAINVRPASIALAPTAKELVRSRLSALGPVRFPESDAAARVERREPRVPLAMLLFAGALLFLLAEGVLSRVFSHASVARASREPAVRSTVGRVRPAGAAARLESEPLAGGRA